MLLRLVKEIEDSIAKECYLPALFVTLTLPDICGKAEFPGEPSNKKRYIGWYDKYLGRYEKKFASGADIGLADRPYLSGELVYQLRCSVLHEGNTDIVGSQIKEEQNQISKFNLVIPKKNEWNAYGTSMSLDYAPNGEVMRREFEVDIPYLCKRISVVAKKYYEEHKEQFGFYSYNVFDEREKSEVEL